MTLVNNLQAVPVQDVYFSSASGDFTLELRLNMCCIMMMSVKLNDRYIARNARCFPGQPVLAYEWQQTAGNFVFMTGGSEYPHYSNFGSSCLLYYTDPGEQI